MDAANSASSGFDPIPVPPSHSEMHHETEAHDPEPLGFSHHKFPESFSLCLYRSFQTQVSLIPISRHRESNNGRINFSPKKGLTVFSHNPLDSIMSTLIRDRLSLCLEKNLTVQVCNCLSPNIPPSLIIISNYSI